MSRKPTLSRAQNESLQGLTLQDKLKLLHKWHNEGSCTSEAFNYFSNRWIRKETRKALDKSTEPTPAPRPTGTARSVIEGELRSFINMLRNRINRFIADRCVYDAELSDKEMGKVNFYLSHYRFYHSLIDELLILGLRYPDKRFNIRCENFISCERMRPDFPNIPFWSKLWEDANLVPLDAVRLMLTKGNDRPRINENLHPTLIRALIPAIIIQRDKEVERLKWAQQLVPTLRSREVSRKEQRLEAFNTLLKAAQEYTSN